MDYDAPAPEGMREDDLGGNRLFKLNSSVAPGGLKYGSVEVGFGVCGRSLFSSRGRGRGREVVGVVGVRRAGGVRAR